MDAMSLVRRAGITYRQLDHWCRKGYLDASRPAEGIGYDRWFRPVEVAVCERMAVLVRCGIRADKAAGIARAWVESGADSVDLGEGISLAYTSRAREVA